MNTCPQRAQAWRAWRLWGGRAMFHPYSPAAPRSSPAAVFSRPAATLHGGRPDRSLARTRPCKGLACDVRHGHRLVRILLPPGRVQPTVLNDAAWGRGFRLVVTLAAVGVAFQPAPPPPLGTVEVQEGAFRALSPETAYE